jgi:8-amino-7-oxononanoate synthase
MAPQALDFTSALYLGLGHASASLRPWDRLTTGAPAALVEAPDAVAVAQRVAALQGCERGLLAPSTLHLFWDLFGALAGNGMAIYADVGVYPIVRWGVERAVARGAHARGFAHHDPDSLKRRLKLDARRGWRPLVVADGFCPSCGELAPVAEYLECARDYGGILVLDDTQALGVLGHSPEAPYAGAPYGKGGGGVLRWSDVSGPDVLVGSSLAKGFGAPVAALCGGRALIERFEIKSETRVHCSPPSAAAVRAAEHALAVNRTRGDALRSRLARLVSYFRRRLAEIDLSAAGGLFPVQTIATGIDAATVYERLRRANVRTVLSQGGNGREARISFLLSARHHPNEIDYALDALAQAMRGKQFDRKIGGKNERSIRV